MTAGNYDIKIERGATFNLSLTWKDANNNPINITGYTAAMMVKNTFADTSPLLSLTSSAGIALGGSAGTIIATASNTATEALLPGVGVYDLELTSPGGVVTRLMQGKVTIVPEVTR